jgi:hypothetical protein
MLLIIIDECLEAGSTPDEDLYCSNSHQNYRTNDDGLFDDSIKRKKSYLSTYEQYPCRDLDQISPNKKAIA